MRTRPILASVILVALAGQAMAQNANVRAVHASPDAPNVDIRVNGALPAPLSNVPFKAASPYLSVTPGTYNFQVTPAGLAAPVVINADVPLASNTTYTVAAMNVLSAIQPVVFVDDNTQNGLAARVRFIHASPNTPTVSVGLAGGGATLFSNVSFTQSGGYISVPGGSYNLEVRTSVGGSPVTLALPTLSLSNNQVYTVWAMGLFGGTGNQELGAVVTVDQIPTPGSAAALAMAGVFAMRRRRRAL
jgi:hypothetical protein